MGWFPSTLDPGESGWKFDVLILLAVIGASAVVKHIPAITASSLSMLPRLMPAPESFLGTDRLSRLPVIYNTRVVGIYSGVLTLELNYFANLIHDVNSIQPYDFKVWKIEMNGETDPESIKRTLRPIKIKSFSAVNAAILASTGILIGLYIAAGVIGDGVALVALTLMGVSSSAASISAWWTPTMVRREAKCKVPPGDQLIATRGGAMVYIDCDENVARELYVGMDKCKFTLDESSHRALLGISTLCLMISVVLFNNCSWKMQLAMGAGFFMLNILYWILALLIKPRTTWDLRRYNIQSQEAGYESPDYKEWVKEWEEKDGETDPSAEKKKYGRSYTQSLWFAIQKSGTTEWVKRSGVMPDNKVWDKWLEKANEHLDTPGWNAVQAKDTLFERDRQ